MGDRTAPAATRRLWCALALLAFVATGPGTAGVEVAFHLSGGGAGDHARGVHLEQAGSGAHADHCQLGLTAHDGRLPTNAAARLWGASSGREVVAQLDPLPPPAQRHALPDSRAPPAV